MDTSEAGDSDSEEWDDESMLEDALEQIFTSVGADDPNEPIPEDEVWDPEEAERLKQRLKKLGEERFAEEVLIGEGMSDRRCLAAFGIRPPRFLPEEVVRGVLMMAMGREMMKRRRLPGIDSVEKVVELLKTSKRIIVLTGAGVSVFFL